MNKLCKVCEKEIPSERGKFKYCSEECFENKSNAKPKEHKPKRRMFLGKSYAAKCQKLYGLFQSNKW